MEERNYQIVRDLEEEKQVSFYTYINELREETRLLPQENQNKRRSQKKHHLQDMSVESDWEYSLEPRYTQHK